MSDPKMPFSAVTPPARYLFGPGPTQVDRRVYEVMTKPIVGHLDPYFFNVLSEVRGMLRAVFGTSNELTLAISGTGSAGMETAVANFVEPGMRVGVFANGFFCDRITEMCNRHAAKVARFEKPWGEVFSDTEASAFIRREKPQVVIYVQAETSTGAFQQGRTICSTAHEVGAIVITDCVTSLGAMPVQVDETGIDVAYSCSQKGLSCPPGLSPFTASPLAMERLKARKSPIREWYLDLRLLEEYYDGPHKYHHTAPISMFYALHQALAVISEEGLEQRWKRHHDSYREFVNRIEALGLQMHVSEGHRIWNLNTPRVPEEINDAAVRKTLLDQDGIEILSGFGQLAGKIFRIGVMGPLATQENLDFFFDRFSNALAAAGYKTPATVSH